MFGMTGDEDEQPARSRAMERLIRKISRLG